LCAYQTGNVEGNPAYRKSYATVESWWFDAGGVPNALKDIDGTPNKGRHFMWYDAGPLAIDKSRPFQIIGLDGVGALCGKCRTKGDALRAVAALDADKDAGVLPNNLSNWDKKHLLG